jgi:WD40 repeat protein
VRRVTPIDADFGVVDGAIHFGDDGRSIAASGPTHARVWEVATNRRLVDLPAGHVVAAQPTGPLVAVAPPTGQIELRDTRDGVVRARLTPTGAVQILAIDPGGTHLLAAGDHIDVWDVASGRDVAHVALGQAVTTATLLRDGRRAIVDGSLMELPSGKVLSDLATTMAVGIAHTRDELVLGGMDGATIVDGENGQTRADLRASDVVYGCAFSPDDSRVVGGGRDGRVKVWDVASGRLVASLEGHASAVLSVAYSPDGSFIATSSTDRTVRVWDATTLEPLLVLPAHQESVRRTQAVFSPQGNTLLTTGDGSPPALWMLQGMELPSSSLERLFKCRIPVRLEQERIVPFTRTCFD